MKPPTDAQLAVWKQLQWANALIMARFKSDLARSGLSVEEFDVLVHLAWAPSETLTLRELTATMVVSSALTRSGLTRLLDRMDRDRLVRRTLSKQDRRRFDVSLTAKGRRRFAQVWPEHADGIRRYFVDPLATEDLDDLDRILSVLIRTNEVELGHGDTRPDNS
ncbi:MAG TPA: MarR family winged helix-turn-helix transcriptional regulator [Nocardioidaceae bacterium]